MVADNTSVYFGSLTYGQYIFLQSLYLPIGFCSILGNSLVLMTYFKYKELRNADCAHLIAALAFGDFVSGVGAIIVGLARLETAVFCDFKFTRFFCIFSAVPNLFGIEMSQAMTMSIAIDRFRAVTSPFAYRAKNHRRYAAISFAIAILCGCVILLLSTIGNDFSNQPSLCTWSEFVFLILFHKVVPFFLSRAVFVPVRRRVNFSGLLPPLLAIGCVMLRHAAHLHVILDDIHPSSSWSPSSPLPIDFHPLHNLPNVVIWLSFHVAIPAEAVFLRFLDDRHHAESSSDLSVGDLV
jgi:hypothetical protein